MVLRLYYLYTGLAKIAVSCNDAYKRMPKELNPKLDTGHPTVYEIRIEGHLGREWTDWFEGLNITLEDEDETVLTGPVVDQAALYGLLKKVRNLGMPLISVNCVKPCQEDVPDVKS